MKVKPKNSAQNKKSKTAAFKKVRIKKIIDSIEFREEDTVKPHKSNKKQMNKCNNFINLKNDILI
jgi:hypothetical protein